MIQQTKMRVQKMQMEWQTVTTLIRLQEQSDQGLHCFLRPICLTVDGMLENLAAVGDFSIKLKHKRTCDGILIFVTN